MSRSLHDPRTRSAALAVSAASITLAFLGATTFATSALMDRELRFLDPYRQPSIDEAMVLCAMEYAVGTDAPNDVIFLGGSSCRCGIDPRQLPMSAYNLGSHAGLQPEAILLTMRGYLAHHPAPKLTVLCLSPISFDFRDDDEWATGITSRFVADYGGVLGGPTPELATAEHFIRRGFGQFLTFRQPDLRGMSLRGYESETFWTYRQKLSDGRGFFPIGSGRDKNCRLANVDLPFVVSPRWSSLVLDLVRECEARRGKLFVLFTPVFRALAQARDMSAADRWLKQIASDNPHVFTAGSAVWSVEDDLMWDSVHLNAAGVARFMPIVAKDVQAVLGK